MSERLQVLQLERRGGFGQVSIERVFKSVRAALPGDIDCQAWTCPHPSRGIAPRILNAAAAANRLRRVNHVTGDVHYLTLAMPGARTVLTIHDSVSLKRLKGFKRRLFRWLWYVEPVRRAALVTAVSESTNRELLHELGVVGAKIRVIPNCVGKEFVPALKPFNAREPKLLFVGTGENKNLERVAAALEGIKCQLHIIGALRKPQLQSLRTHRIRFTNIQMAMDGEMVSAYRDCDAVLFPSMYEGFGLPIVEGNATGRVVVTSNTSAMPEVAGAAACLVDPVEAGSIRTGLLRVIRDAEYRQGLIAAGFENVKRFTPEKIAKQYAAVYRELSARGEDER